MKSSIKYIIPIVVFLLWSDVARAYSGEGASSTIDFLISMVLWFLLSFIITIVFSIAWAIRRRTIFIYFTLIGLLSLFILFMRLVFLLISAGDRYSNRNQTLVDKIKAIQISDNPNIAVISVFFVLAMIALILAIVSFKQIKKIDQR